MNRDEQAAWDMYQAQLRAARGVPPASDPEEIEDPIGAVRGAVNAVIFTGAVGIMVWVVYAWVMLP